MASIQDILGWRNISTSVQKVETGIPNRLPPALTSTTENVLGDRTTYVTFYGQRQVARRAEYGAQSRARALRPIGEKSVTLLHFPEHIKIRQELMLRLRNPNDLMAQQIAQAEIARHGADFRQLFDNARVAAITLMLSKGYIYIDSAGNLVTTSPGSSGLTIDYGIGANNRNQCNGIIDTTWSNVAAPIIQHIENLKIQSKKNTGRDLEHGFYGANIPNYLYTNTTLKAYWQYNQALYGQLQSNPGTIPNGTLGIKEWHRMGDTFFATNNDVNASETISSLWDADQITFTPGISSNTYTLYEGSIAVPKRLGVESSVEGALGGIELVYGMGGYAVLEADPVGIKEVYFDTMLPHWKSELDIFIVDVTF